MIEPNQITQIVEVHIRHHPLIKKMWFRCSRLKAWRRLRKIGVRRYLTTATTFTPYIKS